MSKKKKNRSRGKHNHPPKAASRPVATSISKYSEDTLVSVILITETVDDDGIYAALRVLELISDNYTLDDFLKSLPKTFSTQEISLDIGLAFLFLSFCIISVGTRK